MNIMVIQLGRIGDMILQSPIFSSIKAHFPDSVIHVVAGRHNYQVIEDNPFIDKLFIFEKTPIKLVGLLIKLSIKKYDIYIDPKDHDSTESHILAFISRAGKKIGYHSQSKIFDIFIPSHKDNKSLFFTEIGFKALEPLGIKMGTGIPKPQLFTNTDSERYVADYLHGFDGKPFILFNLSAGKTERTWLKEKWAELTTLLNTEKYLVAITFTESEKQDAEFICSCCPAAKIFYSRNMKDIISIVKASEVVFTPDTSIVHVASAFDKHVVAMYNHNPENLAKFRPVSSNHVIIMADSGKLILDIDADEIAQAIYKQNEFYSLDILNQKTIENIKRQN